MIDEDRSRAGGGSGLGLRRRELADGDGGGENESEGDRNEHGAHLACTQRLLDGASGSGHRSLLGCSARLRIVRRLWDRTPSMSAYSVRSSAPPSGPGPYRRPMAASKSFGGYPQVPYRRPRPTSLRSLDQLR